MTTGPYTDIDFVLSGSEGRGDFIGISGSGLDKAAIGVFTCESGSENFLSKSAGTILNVYNGPYQYPSWQQVRNLYNPIVRKLVRESTLSLMDDASPVTTLSGEVRSKRGSVSCFKEPVVSDNSKPLRHSLEVQPNIGEPTVTTSSFTYTYDNNLASFTNVTIRNRLGIDSDDKESLYKNISPLYLDLSEINLNTNPVRKFDKLRYSHVLYPSAINAFLNTTRTRTDYGEVAGTGSDGYDRIFGHQRTFFKEDQLRTLGTASNSQGYSALPYSAVATDYTSSFTADGSFDDAVFYKDVTSGMESATAVSYYADGEYTKPWCFKFGSQGAETVVPERYVQWKSKFLNHPLTDKITVAFDVMRGNHWINPDLEQPDLADAENLLIQYRTATGSWTNFDTNPTITVSECLNDGFTTHWSASVDFDGAVTEGEQAEIRVAMTQFSSFFYDNYAIQDLKIEASEITEMKDFLNFNPLATDGIKSFPDSSSYRNYDGELMGDTDNSMFSITPMPSMAFTEQTHLANSSGSLQVLSDYVERLTEKISGKNPWYDTYEKYADDVRPIRKGMSIIPEFRMSDFVNYYLMEKGGNFRAINDKFLLLDGAYITASAMSPSSSINKSFLERYSDSSDSNRLYKMAEDHEDIANISRIELSCRGLKKLLPYNGFYPADRTIQLGNLLSQSVGPHITGTSKVRFQTKSYSQALQGLLKPLVSPGILYNSIKAGIAVDYPIYTGKVPGAIDGIDNSPFDFKLSEGSNYRLPFEALLNLKGTMPEGENNEITLVSSFASFQNNVNTEDIFKYKFFWDGEKSPLFELGMHNFLAETVDFFLEDGRLTSYQSKPDDQWDEFESSKTYYMDVVLRDTVEMNKFAEYRDFKSIPEVSRFNADDLSMTNPATGSAFGWATSIVEGAPGEGVYALVGAKWQPVVGGTIGPGAAYLFQNKLSGRGWEQIHTITASDGQDEDYFGNSVSLASGSGGLYMAIGARGAAGTGTNDGKVYLYHSASFGIFGGPGTFTEQLMPNDSAADAWTGYSVSAQMDGTGKGVHVLAGMHRYSADDGAGAAILWHSTSAGISSDRFAPAHISTGDLFGYSVSLVSGTTALYMAIGAPGVSSSAGTAYLMSWNSSDGAEEMQALSSSDGAASDFFGLDISILSASNEDCLYSLVGAPYWGPDDEGAAYLYRVPTDPALAIGIQKLTASEAKGPDAQYGLSTSMVSSSGGISMLIGAPRADYPTAESGSAFFYHSQSSGITITEQHVSGVFPTTSPAANAAYFGYGTSIIEKVGTDTIYAMVGEPYGQMAAGNWATGMSYLFTGTVGSMGYNLLLEGVSFDYQQHGKLFGMALETAYDPAYCAYTPPYFYGDAVARISYSPQIGGPKTLDDIFAASEVENLLATKESRMASFQGSRLSLTALQDANKMPVSASVNMFGKFSEPSVTYDSDGNPISVDQNSLNQPAWVVSTRFESPVLDTYNSEYDKLYTSRNPLIDQTFDWETKEIEDVLSSLDDPSGIALDLVSDPHKMYWSETGTERVKRADLDGGNVETLFTPEGSVMEIAVDAQNGKIYYTDKISNYVHIYEASLSGTNKVDLYNASQDPNGAAGTARGIAVDSVGGMIYWTDSSRSAIYRIPIEGTGSTPTAAVPVIENTGPLTVDQQLDEPGGIALDIEAGMLYSTDWSSLDSGEKILSAEIPATASAGPYPRWNVMYEKHAAGFPMGIALDIPRRQLYWADGDDEKIYRFSMDGDPCCTQPETVVDLTAAPGTFRYIALDLGARKIYWTDSSTGKIQRASMDGITRVGPRTVWTSYGDVPSGSKGVHFGLRESFPSKLNSNSPTTGSLIQACKFTIPEEGKTKVGKVRQTKEISEAIVAIPYFENAVFQEEVVTAAGEQATVELTVSPATGSVGGKHFIRIPKWNFDGQRQGVERGGPAVSLEDGTQIGRTTISDMIHSMKKYMIPPNLDFVKYNDIDPFVMYVFEFNHTLQQKELTDIWQGVMPSSALKMEEDEVTISHNISKFDFFGNVADRKMLGNMKFLIFKVKRKARHNYYELTKDSTDDARFNFTFQGDPTAGAVGLGGSYNWPYDFFSLIEKAKIEAKFTIKANEPPAPAAAAETEGEE